MPEMEWGCRVSKPVDGTANRYSTTSSFAEVRKWVDSLTEWPTEEEIEAHTLGEAVARRSNRTRSTRQIARADIVCLLDTRPYRGFCPLRPIKRERQWIWKEPDVSDAHG